MVMNVTKDLFWFFLISGLVCLISGCNDDQSQVQSRKIYDKTITTPKISKNKLSSLLERISKSTQTEQKDVEKDLDGNDMFIYSNSKVMIFVRRKFDDECLNDKCVWKITVSPTDLLSSEKEQTAAVNEAFFSIENIEMN